MTNETGNAEETTLPNQPTEQQPLEAETTAPETAGTPAGTTEPAATASQPPPQPDESGEEAELESAEGDEADAPRLQRSGNIFFVGVPIGNDGDITLRAIRTLANADVVVCEEAKVGARIMRTHNISAKLMEMNEHNEEEAAEEVIALLDAGKTVAVISDAGLPLVADPGAALVQKLRERELRPTVIPGVSSITTALMVSGFGIDEFDMIGFLPRKIGERESAARALRHRLRTVVILETPYRLRSLLSILSDAMPTRPAALAMNLTMPNESVLHDTLAGLNEKFVEKKFRGEFVVVLGPYSGSEEDEREMEMEREMEREMEDETLAMEPAANAAPASRTPWSKDETEGGSRPIRKRSAERFMLDDDGNDEAGSEEEADEERQPRRSFNDRRSDDRPRRSSEARNNDRNDDRPRRSFGDRNDDRPRRNFGDRDNDRPRRSFGDRNDDRPRRNFGDRNDDRPRRNFGDRNDDRPRRNFGDRNDDRPRRNFGDRDNDRPRRNFGDRNDDRPRRNFGDRNDDRPRRNFGDRDNDRPRRNFGDRDNDRPRRNFGDRDNDRPRRNFGDRDNDRPRRNFNKGFGGGRPGGGKKFGGKR
ncbi:MAG: hypothetical protein DYG96_06845 [Chlorobi bacterium CHB2]|nr:hypothetical protein [Chlorobi bacterium CHB2]